MSLKRRADRADHHRMRVRSPSLSDERGYTLVELMVAAVVLVVGGLGAFSLLDGANKTTVSNNARMGATNLAREILEDARSLDYGVLNDTQMVGALQAKVGIDGSASPWNVSRRGIKYTIEASVCTFDDPKDNVAVTPPADVCTPQAPVPPSAGALEPETQPDDFRRVNVRLSWDIGRGTQTVDQTSLINNPAGGIGPRITFTAPPDNVNQFATTATSATFPTVATPGAASVRWNSDGSPNGGGDSTDGPITWNTTWQLGDRAIPINPPSSGPWPAQYTPFTVLDGTYTVTAQAFDDRGVAGDARVAVLPLNRSEPLTVTGFEAGRNVFVDGSRVDFLWEPNPERDIIGYRVYNAGPDTIALTGDDSVVCSTAKASATSCSDMSPPAAAVRYFVVALDRTDITDGASLPRESDYAHVVTVPSLPSVPPVAPVLLPIAAETATGNPRLTWTHPDIAGVRFFRIYRDACCNVNDRYDSTPGNGTSWVDPAPGATTHRYWVTAVGPSLGESGPSNSADSALP